MIIKNIIYTIVFCMTFSYAKAKPVKEVDPLTKDSLVAFTFVSRTTVHCNISFDSVPYWEFYKDHTFLFSMSLGNHKLSIKGTWQRDSIKNVIHIEETHKEITGSNISTDSWLSEIKYGSTGTYLFLENKFSGAFLISYDKKNIPQYGMFHHLVYAYLAPEQREKHVRKTKSDPDLSTGLGQNFSNYQNTKARLGMPDDSLLLCTEVYFMTSYPETTRNMEERPHIIDVFKDSSFSVSHYSCFHCLCLKGKWHTILQKDDYHKASKVITLKALDTALICRDSIQIIYDNVMIYREKDPIFHSLSYMYYRFNKDKTIENERNLIIPGSITRSKKVVYLDPEWVGASFLIPGPHIDYLKDKYNIELKYLSWGNKIYTRLLLGNKRINQYRLAYQRAWGSFDIEKYYNQGTICNCNSETK